MSETVKAAIYTRVSTEEQAQPDKTSLAQQRERAEAFCKAHGWQVVEVYEDAGVSGAKSSRPALNSMLADAGEGKFQRVVFLKLDRLGRNLRDLLNISHGLDEISVGIVSIHDSFDTGTSSGRLFFSILGAVTEFERDLITERTTSGRLGAARNGRYLGGQTPFGYDYDSDTKRLVVNDAEAAVVHRIYRMYIDEGLSHQRIARRLNDDGVSTKTTRVAARSHDGIKKGWMGSQIGKMLIDPLYKGQTYYNRTRKSGGRHPGEEWIPVEVASVVTEEEWEAVRLRAKRNLRESQRPQDKRSEFLLSGLIRCQECGQTMTASTKRHRANGKAYTYRRYVCVGQKQYKTKCRTPLEPSAELIEGNVLGLLADTFSDPVKVLAACRAYGDQFRAEQEEQEGHVAALKRHLAKAEAERDRYIELYGKGAIKEADLNKRLSALDADAAKSEEDLLRLEEAAQQKAVVQEIEQSAYAIAEQIKPIIDEMTLEEKKELVRTLAERVWVDSENEVTVECVVPGLIPGRNTATTRSRSPAQAV